MMAIPYCVMTIVCIIVQSTLKNDLTLAQYCILSFIKSVSLFGVGYHIGRR